MRGEWSGGAAGVGGRGVEKGVHVSLTDRPGKDMGKCRACPFGRKRGPKLGREWAESGPRTNIGPFAPAFWPACSVRLPSNGRDQTIWGCALELPKI